MAASRKRSAQEALFPEEHLPTSPPESLTPPADVSQPSVAAFEVHDRALRSLSDGKLRPIDHPVELATITPLLGKLSFLSRKLWEFLVSYSLSQPSSMSSSEDGVTWRIAASVLKRDSAFTSKDTKYFRASITELQKTLVGWSSSARDKNGEVRSWSSTQLLGSVEFVVDASGRHCVEWSFTPVLLKQLREHRHWFSAELSLVASMRRHSTLALYKLVCRYATLQGGLTPRVPWRSYIPVLTGDPASDGDVSGIKKTSAASRPPKYRDWRYFNRDVISVAVQELNSCQDRFWVQPVTHSRAGVRSVEELQFKITHRDGYVKPAAAPAFAHDMEAVSSLTSYDISSSNAQKLCSKHGTERVLEVVRRTAARIADKTKPPLLSPAGFIISELDRTSPTARQASQPAVDEVFMPDAQAARENLTQQIRSHLVRKCKDAWPNLSEAERRSLLDRFQSEVLPTLPLPIRRAWDPIAPLQKPIVSMRFFSWYASITEPSWNPDDDMLLRFKAPAASDTTTGPTI